MISTESPWAPARQIGPWLAAQTGAPGWAECQVSLISGGKSNLTFRVASDAGEAIIRRPPAGDHAAGAHDVLREARVQQRLASSAVPVPEILGVDSGDLLGVPFYAMQSVDGHCIRERLPAGFATSATDRRGLTFAMIDVFASLHELEPAAVGLADLGRPEGFVERQVNRWRRQWTADQTHPVPAVDELGSRLSASLPERFGAAIVHGDCKLDNLLMDRDDPSRVRALLDWEMSTLGDPLADLAMLLLFWREPGEAQISIVPTVSALPGFPSRAELIERYARRHTIDETHLAFHQGLAHLKFAVILQGIARRSRAGVMAGQNYDDADVEVEFIATEGLRRLDP